MSYQNNRPRPVNFKQQNIKITPPDKILSVVVLFLVIVGLMFIFSASVSKCINSDINILHYTAIQFVGVVLGYILLKWFSRLNYKKLTRFTDIFAIIVIFALFLVLLCGDIINGAQRWISIGPLSIQPSEFAKPAIVLLLARDFSKNANLLDPSKFKAYLLILIMFGLIAKQPNLSMIILLSATIFVMYLAAGGNIPWRKLLMPGLCIFGAGCFCGLGAWLTPNALLKILPIHAYQLQRIQVWIHPEADPLGAGYNVIQSLVAFASGNIWGMGYGASKQKLAWLPEAHTDFIFAVIGNEIGFLGCLCIILLFWVILQRGFHISSKCPDMYGKLIAIGLTFSICFQAFMNMSVASSMLPASGVPLPFISYGGSSVMITLAMIGILLNISRTKCENVRVINDDI